MAQYLSAIDAVVEVINVLHQVIGQDAVLEAEFMQQARLHYAPPPLMKTFNEI